MVKLHSRILIRFILGIAMNIWVLTMPLKEMTMYLKEMAMSFQMTSAFVGVSLMLLVIQTYQRFV